MISFYAAPVPRGKGNLIPLKDEGTEWLLCSCSEPWPVFFGWRHSVNQGHSHGRHRDWTSPAPVATTSCCLAMGRSKRPHRLDLWLLKAKLLGTAILECCLQPFLFLESFLSQDIGSSLYQSLPSLPVVEMNCTGSFQCLSIKLLFILFYIIKAIDVSGENSSAIQKSRK